jgi:hypothetical protein
MASESSEISRLEEANRLGLAYLRTLVLLNGGAILALLTFLGSASTSPIVQFDLASIKCAMWAFLVGISLMLFALLISYSYTATAPEQSWRKFWDDRIITLNSVLGLGALIAFFVGVSSLILGAVSPP